MLKQFQVGLEIFMSRYLLLSAAVVDDLNNACSYCWWEGLLTFELSTRVH